MYERFRNMLKMTHSASCSTSVFPVNYSHREYFSAGMIVAQNIQRYECLCVYFVCVKCINVSLYKANVTVLLISQVRTVIKC